MWLKVAGGNRGEQSDEEMKTSTNTKHTSDRVSSWGPTLRAADVVNTACDGEIHSGNYLSIKTLKTVLKSKSSHCAHWLNTTTPPQSREQLFREQLFHGFGTNALSTRTGHVGVSTQGGGSPHEFIHARHRNALALLASHVPMEVMLRARR